MLLGLLLTVQVSAAPLYKVHGVEVLATDITRIGEPSTPEQRAIAWSWEPLNSAYTLRMQMQNSGADLLTVDWDIATFTDFDGLSVGLVTGDTLTIDRSRSVLASAIPPGGTIAPYLYRRDGGALIAIHKVPDESGVVTASVPVNRPDQPIAWHRPSWRVEVDPEVLALGVRANELAKKDKVYRQLGVLAPIGTLLFGGIYAGTYLLEPNPLYLVPAIIGPTAGAAIGLVSAIKVVRGRREHAVLKAQIDAIRDEKASRVE